MRHACYRTIPIPLFKLNLSIEQQAGLGCSKENPIEIEVGDTALASYPEPGPAQIPGDVLKDPETIAEQLDSGSYCSDQLSETRGVYYGTCYGGHRAR
jgi:hypothetical protein